MAKQLKKSFQELPRLETFLAEQSEVVRDEYREIVAMLEAEGQLSMPFGEKITGENLFAIRVIRAGNVRVFYVYGKADIVYGLSGYVKKTQTIPRGEMELARKLAKLLKKGGLL